MDVLIKNMEMPINCCFCLFKRFSTCILKERIKTKGYHDRKRHPKCPLIPVPEHGDLIDRDALLDSEKMFFAEKYHGDHRTNYDTMMGYEIGNMLRDAPVVLERTT